ncbi:MAG: hypothetical protein LAT53_09320 [Idiomarina sp.]|nr:hypothetical protein [Idiomarina sp.]
MNRIAEALDIVRRAKALGDFDTNVIGMAAEIIAEDDLGMKKAPAGAKTIDGFFYRESGIETVQVKAFSCSRVARYKGGTFFQVPAENGPDELVVIIFYSQLMEYEVLYVGKTELVGRMEANGKRRAIRLDSLCSKEKIAEILNKIHGNKSI